MLDAGSTGTRVYVYKWPSRTIRTMTFIDITHDVIHYNFICEDSCKKNKTWASRLKDQKNR
jgi:hypothetical protein